MTELSLNASLFSAEPLKKAIEDYQSLAEIMWYQADGYYMLSFRDCRFDPHRTAMEFENYMIGLENS